MTATTPGGWIDTSVAGVRTRTATVHPDERGSFAELWRAAWTQGLTTGPFVQANLTRSRARVLRGMHFHRLQSDLWIVLEGTALVAVADVRPMLDGRAARPSVETHELSSHQAILIPELVAHGFYALTDLTLVYLVTNEFDGSDEHGFAWDDARAATPWRDRDPILSARDRSNPDLPTALAALAAVRSPST